MRKPTLQDLEAELKRQNEALAALRTTLQRTGPIEVPASALDAFEAACVVTTISPLPFNPALRG